MALVSHGLSWDSPQLPSVYQSRGQCHLQINSFFIGISRRLLTSDATLTLLGGDMKRLEEEIGKDRIFMLFALMSVFVMWLI